MVENGKILLRGPGRLPVDYRGPPEAIFVFLAFVTLFQLKIRPQDARRQLIYVEVGPFVERSLPRLAGHF